MVLLDRECQCLSEESQWMGRVRTAGLPCTWLPHMRCCHLFTSDVTMRPGGRCLQALKASGEQDHKSS